MTPVALAKEPPGVEPPGREVNAEVDDRLDPADKLVEREVLAPDTEDPLVREDCDVVDVREEEEP